MDNNQFRIDVKEEIKWLHLIEKHYRSMYAA